MTTDEQAIRKLIADWQEATLAGDLDFLLDLMDEDVVFLLPDKPPMRGREAFARAHRETYGKFRLDIKGDIQEIGVEGNLAYCWNHLQVRITPLPRGEGVQRSGNILTVMRRNADGHWLVYRDSNLLTVEK